MANDFPKGISFEEVPIWAILKSAKLIKRFPSYFPSYYTVVSKTWVQSAPPEYHYYNCYVLVRWFDGSTWEEKTVRLPINKLYHI